jgi:hypothetical protein
MDAVLMVLQVFECPCPVANVLAAHGRVLVCVRRASPVLAGPSVLVL